jgi:uncharacterized repeat protein (TIGR01451 family)
VLSLTGGDVFVQRAGTTTWVRVEASTTLEPGDTLKSGPDSSAEITFFEGSTIELEAGTEIAFDSISLSATGSTTIHMTQFIGTTVSRVNKLTDSASTYEIETQSAVAAVRGSTMTVTVMSDGTTIVGNQHGDIRVYAQGKEVIIPEGYQVTIVPGQEPGQPEPIETPPTTTPPAPVYKASVTTGVNPDRAQAAMGETITYTYFITNTGDLVLANVRVTDNIADTPVYAGGDANANSLLDPGETWTFTAAHVVGEGDATPLVNSATFSANIPSYEFSIISTDHAQVVILSGLYVIITTPADGAAVSTRTINIQGLIGNTAVSGNISINGETHAIAFNGGGFNLNENISNGVNVIIVSATDGQDIASDTITVNADIPIYGIWVELTWDTDNTDLDSHFLRPGAEWQSTGDCYFGNPNPDWGAEGVTTDNPSLDTDVTSGYGPENITLLQPSYEGIYYFDVYYFSGDVPTNATVKIWINGVKVWEGTHLLENEDDTWNAAMIEWPSGNASGFEPDIAIVKTPSAAVAYVGDNITYTYLVTNTGTNLLNEITVTDNVTGAAVYHSGDLDSDGILDFNETWEFTSVHTATEGDIGTLSNSAQASGNIMYGEGHATATDVASVVVMAISLGEYSQPNVGDPYSLTLTALGGTGPYTWQISSGELPSGLELVDNIISGTPDLEGPYTFTIEVTDSLGHSVTLELTFTVTHYS